MEHTPSLGAGCGPRRDIRLPILANPLAGALERSRLLGEADMEALRALPYKEASFLPGQVVLDTSTHGNRILVVAGGVAAIQADFPDGSRQITDLLVAGDVHGLGGVLGYPLGHCVEAVTPLRGVTLDAADLTAVLTARPRIYGALFWASLRRERVLRDHVRIVGRRTARKRVTHLICCLQERVRENGLGTDLPFTLKFTQSVLADAIGLTPIHVGRVLRKLSNERLVRMGRGEISILNGLDLKIVADFTGIH